MDDNTKLRKALIRLAHDNPDGIREHLLPLLSKTAAGDPWVDAAKLIDKPGDQIRIAQKHLDAVRKGFDKAKKELDGHRRFGVGETESVALLQAHVQGPLQDLAQLTSMMNDYVDGLVKSGKRRLSGAQTDPKQAAATTKAEWQKALKDDQTYLKRLQGYIKILEKGDKVPDNPHLTLENAKRMLPNLKAVIENKKKLIKSMP